MNDPLAPLLTTKEVAKRLRLKEPTVQKLCREGRLAASKVGRQYLVAPADLQAYLAAAKT